LDALGKVMIPDHIADLQVLVIDHIIGAHECERRLVMKVLPLAAHLQMRLGQQCNGFAPAVAAFFASGYSAL